MTTLRIPLLALFLLPLTACGGGSSTPSEADAKAAVVAELATHSAGNIQLGAFEKVDAVQGEMFGATFYELQFSGEFEFLADGNWVLGGKGAGFEFTTKGISPSEPVVRGDKRKVTGDVQFVKAEKGWKVNEVSLDLPD